MHFKIKFIFHFLSITTIYQKLNSKSQLFFQEYSVCLPKKKI